MKKIIVILIMVAGCFISTGCPCYYCDTAHPTAPAPTTTPVVIFTPTVTPTP